MTKEFVPIHQHVMFKLESMRPLTRVKDAKEFLVTLVKKINMVPVTKPQAVNVRALGNEGLTGSINLATSHIAFHCWEKTGLLMLDVYSCCTFDIQKVVSVLITYWDIDMHKIRYVDLDRNNDDNYVSLYRR